jgi:hypothetical protein
MAAPPSETGTGPALFRPSEKITDEERDHLGLVPWGSEGAERTIFRVALSDPVPEEARAQGEPPTAPSEIIVDLYVVAPTVAQAESVPNVLEDARQFGAPELLPQFLEENPDGPVLGVLVPYYHGAEQWFHGFDPRGTEVPRRVRMASRRPPRRQMRADWFFVPAGETHRIRHRVKLQVTNFQFPLTTEGVVAEGCSVCYSDSPRASLDRASPMVKAAGKGT